MTPTLLLIRPTKGAQAFARECAALWPDLPIVRSPIMRIESHGAQVQPPGSVILSSASAVPQIAVPNGSRQIAAYCVGPRTAKAAHAAGIKVALTAPDADALIAEILCNPPNEPLLHLRGEHSRGDICQRLNKGGQPCTELVVYRQVSQALTDPARELLSGATPVILPLFSPRSAQLLSLESTHIHAPMWIAALSSAVYEAWAGPADRVALAPTPDAQGMLKAILKLM
ncbi:uroporphyrinogen-III synthase [Actibacterium atlanticum]|uniref:uroporphyrinogen-III synthase n=1 Tax=Actibacterium atlanticum TaxID=1461693 RepID=UPI0005530E22|nr:uroporphyrinogen-III synthase [Actibacterium atlanticum]